MSASLESLSGEKRRLEGQLAQMEADGRHNDRERRSLEQQVGGWVGGWRCLLLLVVCLQWVVLLCPLLLSALSWPH